MGGGVVWWVCSGVWRVVTCMINTVRVSPVSSHLTGHPFFVLMNPNILPFSLFSPFCVTGIS